MVRLFNTYFPRRTLFLLVTESALVFCALGLSLVFLLGPKVSRLFNDSIYWKVALVGMICLVSIYYNDVYDSAIISNPREVRLRLVHALGIACILIGLLYLALPASQICQGFATLGIPLMGAFLLLHREAFFAFNRATHLSDRTLILGEGRLATSLAQEIQSRPELGLRLVGYLGEEWDSRRHVPGVNLLGKIDEITDVANRLNIDRVIVAMGDRRSKLPIEELLRLKTSGVLIQEGADFYEVTTGKLPVETVRLSWLIFSPGFRVSKWTLAYKRVFSFTLAGLAVVLFFPLMALVALLIRIDSPGPAIFKQPRIGKGGKPFTVFKFRTMFVNADSGKKPLPVQDNDDRVTKVGRWLRKFRLDELPQLCNILLGQMHFVGPRPFVPNQEMELASQIPLYTQRWSVSPGATGWAQVQRGYCATVEDNIDKLAYDLFYIKHMSIGLDMLILFKTLKIVFLGRGGR